MDLYQGALIPRKLPCPKNFLATSLHEKEEEYKRYTLEETHCLISNCVTTLKTNRQKIVSDVKEKLPKVPNGAESNVVQKTIESVKIIERAVFKLIWLTKKYDFGQTNLQSSMTLYVEHFHATAHYKTLIITMLGYCKSFGELLKENVKKLSN